jgi:hypothetical protein
VDGPAPLAVVAHLRQPSARHQHFVESRASRAGPGGDSGRSRRVTARLRVAGGPAGPAGRPIILALATRHRHGAVKPLYVTVTAVTDSHSEPARDCHGPSRNQLACYIRPDTGAGRPVAAWLRPGSDGAGCGATLTRPARRTVAPTGRLLGGSRLGRPGACLCDVRGAAAGPAEPARVAGPRSRPAEPARVAGPRSRPANGTPAPGRRPRVTRAHVRTRRRAGPLDGAAGTATEPARPGFMGPARCHGPGPAPWARPGRSMAVIRGSSAAQCRRTGAPRLPAGMQAPRAGPPQGLRAGPPQGLRAGPPQGPRAGPPQGLRAGPPQGPRAGPPQGLRAGPPQGLPIGVRCLSLRLPTSASLRPRSAGRPGPPTNLKKLRVGASGGRRRPKRRRRGVPVPAEDSDSDGTRAAGACRGPRFRRPRAASSSGPRPVPAGPASTVDSDSDSGRPGPDRARVGP